MKRHLFYALFLIFCISASGQDQYAVMLSMDGFRWDYPNRVATPNLDYIARHGIKARSLKPCFPTKTFPNHYSIATGLYPNNHGIVNNSFYDPVLDAVYEIKNREAVENGIFYEGEPIWVTAEKQGITSASFFWVGSEAPAQGIRPTYWKRYDGTVSYTARIDTVISWLSLPQPKRPRLVMFYFDEPDGLGHEYGPGSPQVDSAIAVLDSLVGVLLNKLEALPHYNQINLIITSDHGMGKTFTDKVICLEEYLQEEWIDQYQGSNPNYNIFTSTGYLDSAYTALAKADHLCAWKAGDVPKHLHYGENPRCGDIIVVADSGWSVRWNNRGGYDDGGTHGYVPENTDMHAIFYAFGPSFKEGYSQPTFSNIDIYSIICRILDLKPSRTDGHIKKVKKMFK